MHLPRVPVAIGVTLLLMAAACGRGSEGGSAGNDNRSQTPKSLVLSAKDFDSSRFADDSTNVTNRWFPLKPGTQYVYEGAAFDDGERIKRRVVFTVTDLTKVVAGVRTVVAWDRDYDNGDLIESELAFFAQDTAGNVWHLGQYPEEYEEGKFVKAPAWLEGIAGARAGLAMKAEPQPEAKSYAQGFAPAPLYWDDRARVFKMDQRTCVPVDCYDNVLVMEEFERRKPGAFQLKYYAPGVGGIRVGWRGPKEEEKETLVLTDLIHLTKSGLADARREALALETRAYRISKDVYGRTTPIEKPEAG